MKLERLERRQQAGPPLGTMFGAVLVLGAGVALLWLWLGLPRPVCLFREWIGLPCPTCGSTRLVEALLSGDVLGAFALNPLVSIVLGATTAWAVLSTAGWALGLPGWRLVPGSRERIALRILAVVVVAAGWAYLILRAA